MAEATSKLPKAVNDAAAKMRFPKLFALALLLFLVDLVVPDFIPFIDEILLGLLSLILGSIKEKRKEETANDDRVV